MKIKTMIAIGSIVATIGGVGAGFVALAKNSAKAKNGTRISDFENLIDNKGVPVDYNESLHESRIAPFADLGSWHAFALPSFGDKNFFGGFTQPLIVRKKSPRSIAKSLDVLKVVEYNVELVGDEYVYKGAGKVRSLGKLPHNKVHFKQAPGRLWQEFEFDDFTLQLDLRFVQNKTSFVKYNFINKTNKPKFLKLIWTGKLFAGARADLGTEMVANGLHTKILMEDGGKKYKIKYNNYGQPLFNTSSFYPGAPKEGVLYVTFDRNGGMAAQTPLYYQSGTATIAIGKNGHKPDTKNNWHLFNPELAKAGKIGRNWWIAWVRRDKRIENNLNIAWYDDAGVLQNKWLFIYDPTKPLANFVPDKDNAIHHQSQNSLKINFTKPYNKDNKNFLDHTDEWQWDMQFQKDIAMDIIVTNDKQAYQAQTKKPFIVKANSSNSMFVGTSFTFTAQERYGFMYAKQGDNIGETMHGQLQISGVALNNQKQAQTLFDKSQKRWNLYLKNLIGGDLKRNFDYQKVAVKAMETLVNNWRGNAGMLEHQGVTPSLSIQYFNEFWSWDTWKQATAEVNFDPKLAIDNIRVMFDYQVTTNPWKKRFYNFSKVRQKNDVGMIPDLVAYEQTETNWRDTKPPLSAWAVYNVINTMINILDPQTIDPHTGSTYKQLAIEFGKYIYHRLIAYHLWWYSNRDGDHNGINEYGATIFDGSGNWVNNSKGTIQTATAWESGMDNAIRFDSYGSNLQNDKEEDYDSGLEYTIQRNTDGTVTGYVLQQESVELNSYMYAEKNYIIKLGRLLNNLSVGYNELQGSPIKKTKDLTYKYLVKPGIIQRLKNLHANANASDYVKNLFKNFGKSYEKDAASLANDMKHLKDYINSKMFHPKTGFFYDLKWELGSDGKTRDVAKDRILFNRGAASEGFIPLWANVAIAKNAKAIKTFVMSPEGFNTHMPFPTAAYNNHRFEPDQYWRGPVWLDQAYFGVQGLKSNGFTDEASYMVNKLFQNAEGLLEGAPIFENYNPLTGKSLNAKGFSWSAGMYLLMYKNYVKGGS